MSTSTNEFSPEVRACGAAGACERGRAWLAPAGHRVASAKIGCAALTLNEWVKRAEVEDGCRAGVPAETAERMKALERENRKLRQADEVLRKAGACFAQAEVDRRPTS